MSESGDYTPAPWASAHSFADARRDYADKVVARGSVAAASIGVTELAPDKLICNSENPFVIACDVTGSMGVWPTTIFSKLGFLEHEARDYLGEDMEVSFAAIGDHTAGDRHPFQARPFSKGSEMKKEMELLIHDKGGGGDSEESYELCGLYYAENCEFPNAIRKPLMIIIGDEGIHSILNKSDALKWAKAEIKERMSAKEIFAKLRQKFEVYIIRKPYGSVSETSSSPQNDRIQKQWEEMLGADHVVILPEAERVVDVMFGILGEFTGRYDDFVKELKERQGKDADGKHKINVVLKSLCSVRDKKSLPKLPAPARAKSVTRKSIKGDKSVAPPSGAISLRDDDDD